MSLEIERCSHGSKRLAFSEAIDTAHDCDELLCLLTYREMPLATTQAAGDLVCDPEHVGEEQTRRRRRFVTMAPEDLARCRRYLEAEGMYMAVLADIQSRVSPAWSDLSDQQKAWAKLTCVYNHTDRPDERLVAAIDLVQRCILDGSLPKPMALALRGGIERLRHDARHGLRDMQIRQEAGRLAEGILLRLPDAEQTFCHDEALRDYQCTSDCFRGLRVGNVR